MNFVNLLFFSAGARIVRIRLLQYSDTLSVVSLTLFPQFLSVLSSYVEISRDDFEVCLLLRRRTNDSSAFRLMELETVVACVVKFSASLAVDRSN